MRMLTILLNMGQLVFVAVMLLERGMPSVDDGDFWIALLLTTVPAASLTFLARYRSDKPCGESLFQLYLERRKLEEKIRIKSMSAEK